MKIDNIKLPSNFKFGLFFSSIFLLLSIYFFYYKKDFVFYIFLVLFLITIFITFFFPEKLLRFNRIWMQFGLLIGKIISPIVIGVIFFILITPIALFFKIFKRDELHINKNIVNSYWRNRITNEFDSKTFKNQF